MQTGSNQPTKTRIGSIDAYRGLVMLLMMAEALRFCAVSAARPASAFWKLLCQQQTHVEWAGCSLHDLIQPAFCLLVGAALPFSISSRRSRGQGFAMMTGHAVFRSIILIFLGMAMHDVHLRHWYWDFAGDALTQIGLGYTFVFLLCFRPVRDWWIALAVILLCYWIWFAVCPLPGPAFDYSAAGVDQDWLAQNGLSGFAAHWQKNSNPAWAFDVWFLNLFPQTPYYIGQLKGLTTLNFIPTMGTMILGMLASEVLRGSRAPWLKVRWLALTGAAMLASGWMLGAAGICPVVKSIWTPSWVLFSGGWCYLFLAAFYALVDIGGLHRLVYPLIVIGANSIFAYCLAHVFPAYAFNSLRRVFGSAIFRVFGDAYEPVVYGAAVLLIYWLLLYILYRRKIFLRI